ncbi:hypothetical protein Scep_024102 [Stephania cephalantha]|uniref:Uncharacterized protein n=1 Tax=Stephania cephalantha TaxID=152367 RepID=A0AAP0EYT2_9MAGN
MYLVDIAVGREFDRDEGERIRVESRDSLPLIEEGEEEEGATCEQMKRAVWRLSWPQRRRDIGI